MKGKAIAHKHMLHIIVPPYIKDSYQNFVIACSGGIDSVCLAHYMALYSGINRKNIYIFHVHHGLREESDKEADFVKHFAQKLNISCSIYYLSMQHYGMNNMLHKARYYRYQIMAKHLPPKAILLTAHHGHDQWENFFIRLQRSSALKGLSPMKEHSYLYSDDHKVNIWRPFLPYARDDIELYAKHHQLSWVHDVTNDNLSYKRNRIRHLTKELALDWTMAKKCWALLAHEQDQMDKKTCHHIQQMIIEKTDGLTLCYHEYQALAIADKMAFWHYFFAQYSHNGYAPKHKKICNLIQSLEDQQHKTLGGFHFIPQKHSYHITFLSACR